MQKTVHIVRDSELAKKLPTFSLVSTMLTMNKALSMQTYHSDHRLDDIYIDAKDGDEMPPPPEDNLGRKRKVNIPALVATNL